MSASRTQPEYEQRADTTIGQQFTDLILDSRLRGNDEIPRHKKGFSGSKYEGFTLFIQEQLACSLPDCDGAVLLSSSAATCRHLAAQRPYCSIFFLLLPS